MMGTTHVSSGAVTGLLTLPLLPTHTLLVNVSWVTAVAGCALLPDLDHPHSTASRMWGPLTRTLSRPIAWISQGHRWGTHDLILGPAAFAAAAWVASQSRPGAVIVYAFAVGLALQGLGSSLLGRVGAGANLLFSAGAGYALSGSTWPGLPAMVAAAAALGAATHIAGDALTPEQVPLPILWIRTRARIGISAFGTNGRIEHWLVAPGLSALGLWLFWIHADLGGWSGVTESLTSTWSQVAT